MIGRPEKIVYGNVPVHRSLGVLVGLHRMVRDEHYEYLFAEHVLQQLDLPEHRGVQVLLHREGLVRVLALGA